MKRLLVAMLIILAFTLTPGVALMGIGSNITPAYAEAGGD
jgi:predicted small secreted protein